MKLRRNPILLLAAIVAGLASPAGTRAEPLATVPFVGCRADGQMGPQAAPKAPLRPIMAPRSAAGSLAYYGGDAGVLGPRGWRCFELYGSSGVILIVTPEPHGQDLFEPKSVLKGPAIEFSISDGETSGRFEAARVAARLFPTRRAFVRDVIAEGIEPPGDFPEGPFPGDRLTRRSDTVIEFQTPARAQGMGTMSRLAMSGDPIEGFARIGEDNSVTMLQVRLPMSLRHLAPAILRDSEARSRSGPN